VRKFKFSLHKLLEMKASNLEILKIEISKLNGEVEKIRSKIESATEEISNSQEKMDNGIGNIRLLKEWMSYIQSLYLHRKELVSQLIELEKRLDEMREKYTEMYKEHKALENLKNLQKKVYNLNVLREEQKIIDDLALVRKKGINP